MMKLDDLKTYPLDILQKLFDETDLLKVSVEVATVRGWIMDAIEEKATSESFEMWLNDGKTRLKSKR